MEYSATSISDVLLHDLDSVSDDRGRLTYFEIQKAFEILPCRVFFIQTDGASTRGGHAHRLCNQIFICNSGSVKITCSDSKTITEYRLQVNTIALFVPKGIWVDLDFQGPALITVLCDQQYMESKYIRSIETFKLEKNVL